MKCFPLILLLSAAVTAQIAREEYRAPDFEFEGNKAVMSALLERVMVQCAIAEEVESDDEWGFLYCFENAKPLYWKQGYLRAKAASAKFEANEKATIVRIKVDEGVVYRFSGFEFDTVCFTENLRMGLEKMIPLRIGEIAQVGIDVSRVRIPPEDIQCGGTPLLGIDIVPIFDVKSRYIKYWVSLSPATDYNFDRVEFLGNEGTRDYFIRRHLRFGEGDQFSENRVEAGIRRLNNAEIMQPIDYEKDIELRFDDEQKRVNILIRMKERN